MSFRDRRKKQLGIKSLGDMIRSGEVKTEIDPSLFVNGNPEVDCLEDKWARGEVLGIVAPSGGGKTEFTLSQQVDILKNNPDEIATFVSLEMKSQKIAQRMWKICDGDLDIMDRFFIISNFDEDGRNRMLNTTDITNEAHNHIQSLGKNMCCMAIDHLHILKPTSKQGNDLNNIAQSVKDIAVELNTFVILLSQTTKGKSGAYGDKMLDADASYNCSQFRWVASWVITLHQPLARVQSIFDMPILAWGYMKIREKLDGDKVQAGEFQLLYYEMSTRHLRPLTANEMITFSSAHGQVLEMIKEEEDNNGGAMYNTRVDGKALSDRDKLLGDTYAPIRKEKQESDTEYVKRTTAKSFRK